MGLINKILGHASDLTSDQAREELDGVLLPDEPVEVAFKIVRDLFVFTDSTPNSGRQTEPHGSQGGIPHRSLSSHHLILDRECRDL